MDLEKQYKFYGKNDTFCNALVTIQNKHTTVYPHTIIS